MITGHPWYQVVAFAGSEPKSGQEVYGGHLGWLPQVAIRRRFWADDEEVMLKVIGDVAAKTAPLNLTFADIVQPAHMPVEIIQVEATAALCQLHAELLLRLGNAKFPDREGDHYYPHMTISWKGERVVDAETYARTRNMVEAIWIIKDKGPDSVAIKRFKLAAPMV
jgi:hypothetical protein